MIVECSYCYKPGSAYKCSACDNFSSLCNEHVQDHICPKCDTQNVTWSDYDTVIEPPWLMEEDNKDSFTYNPNDYNDPGYYDVPYQYGNPQSWQLNENETDIKVDVEEEEEDKQVLIGYSQCEHPDCRNLFHPSEVGLYDCGTCNYVMTLCEKCNSLCPECGNYITSHIQNETSKKTKELKTEYEKLKSDTSLEDELDFIASCDREDEGESSEEIEISPENYKCTNEQVNAYNEKQKNKTIKLLPPYAINDTYCGEYIRQLTLQIKAIEKMTVWEWMVNTALNRLKDPQLAEGQITADFIFKKLDKNKELAIAVLQKLRDRSEELKTNKKGDFHTELIFIIDKSLESENPIRAFYEMQGMLKLTAQQYAGGEGGSGRQHGSGDEKTYRELHEDAIELLKTNLETNSKKPSLAVLHNPDQCVGGPMEILWDDEDRKKTIEAKINYFACQKRVRELTFKLNEPEEWQIVPVDKEKLGKEVNELKEELKILEKEYLEQVFTHVGLSFVNTQIGFCWMPEKGPSKVVHIFNEALKIPFPKTTYMSIGIPIIVRKAQKKTTEKKEKAKNKPKNDTKKRKRMSESDKITKNLFGKKALVDKKRKVIEEELKSKKTPLITNFTVPQNTLPTITLPSIQPTVDFQEGDKVKKKNDFFGVTYTISKINKFKGTAILTNPSLKTPMEVKLSDLKMA